MLDLIIDEIEMLLLLAIVGTAMGYFVAWTAGMI